MVLLFIFVVVRFLWVVLLLLPLLLLLLAQHLGDHSTRVPVARNRRGRRLGDTKHHSASIVGVGNTEVSMKYKNV